MTRTISATEARVRLGQVLRDVADRGQTILVERSGRPSVVLMPVNEYERLRTLEHHRHIEEWEKRLDELHAQIGDIPDFDVMELINGGRQERDDAILAAVHRRESDHSANPQ